MLVLKRGSRLIAARSGGLPSIYNGSYIVSHRVTYLIQRVYLSSRPFRTVDHLETPFSTARRVPRPCLVKP